MTAQYYKSVRPENQQSFSGLYVCLRVNEVVQVSEKDFQSNKDQATRSEILK